MKLRSKLSLLLLSLAILPCIVAPADAARFTIASSGTGVFTLSGAGLSGVGGIEATIEYDTATLANPRVVQGGLVAGGMFMANTNSPGAIRIVAISPREIAGSGIVATVTFDRQGGSEGKILFLTAGLIDSDGSALPAPQTQVVNPVETASAGETPPTPPSTTAQTPQVPAETPGSSSGGQGYGTPGTITIPGESGEPAKQQPPQEILQEKPVVDAKKGEVDKDAPETAPEQKSAAAQTNATPPKGKDTIYPSVLERFRTFKGEKKTPKSLTALFDAAVSPGVTQAPVVALTDGATRVTVSIRNLPAGKEVPNFALRGAKLISLKMDGDAWVIEALPDKNAHEAAITALHDGSRTEIPLTLAPPVNAANAPAGGLTEAGFTLFLNERGTDKAPRFDLNGDGVRNYLDDYIFAANVIVERDSKTKAPTRIQQ